MRSWNDYKKTMIQTDNLWLAAKEGDPERVSLLLARGADVNGKDHRGYSPLMLAAYSGNEEMVVALLERGADPNSADFGGNSVLMGAAFKGYRSIVERLVAAGANIKAQNASGMDDYDFAVGFGRVDIAEYLRNQGLAPGQRNRWKSAWGVLVSRFKRSAPHEA